VTRLLGWRLLRGSLAQLVLCSLLWVAPAHLPAQSIDPEVRRLVDALQDVNAITRRDAAEALGNLGPAAAPAAEHLVAAWKDEDSAVRRQSVAAVKKIGKAAAASVRRDQTDPSQRTALDTVVDVLIPALRDSDRNQRVNAISAVRVIGRGSERTYPVMLEYMELDDPSLRVGALEAMNAGSPRIFAQHLREAADRVYSRKDDGGVRSYRIVLLMLSRLSHQLPKDEVSTAVETFRSGLRRDEPSFRRYAAEGLGNMRTSASPAIPDLVRTLDDPVHEVYEAARDALDRVGTAALPAFAELLKRDDVDIRRFAARAIGARGASASVYVKDLVHIVDNSSEDIKTRAIAVGSLGDIGKAASTAVPDLIALFSDENEQLRLAAVRAVGQIETATVKQIAKALIEQTPSKAKAAIEAIGDPAGEAVRIRQISAKLMDRLNDTAASVRAEAATWLGDILARAGRPRSSVSSSSDATERNLEFAATSLRQAAEHAVSPLLNVAKNDPDLPVRVNAIVALGRIVASQQTVLPALVDLFGADDKTIRQAASNAVKNFGPPAIDYVTPELQASNERVRKAAMAALTGLAVFRNKKDRDLLVKMVPTFIQVVSSDDTQAARIAIDALRRLGPDAAEGVPALIEIVENKKSSLRGLAIQALGAIGAPAKSALPDLAKIIESDVDSSKPANLTIQALRSTASIADSMFDESDTGGLSELRAVNETIQSSPVLAAHDSAKRLNRAVELLDYVSWAKMEDELRSWIVAHPIISAVVPLYVLWILFWSLMLQVRPLSLLRINRALSPLELTLPDRLGGMTLPVRYVFFVGFLNYHSKVLDAWVRAHIDAIRERFAAKETVHDREVHVPVPVEIDRRVVADLRPKHLRGIFARQLGFLLIWGEGGAGKTSLACRVGRRALSDDPEERLGSHLMIPVLLEHEQVLRDGGEDSLLTAVAQQLQDLCDLADPIPSDLLQNLLRQRRVLVIIDHLSELRESTRAIIQQQLRHFRARALIITSRLEEDFEGFSKTTVRPLRIAGNRLSSFMEAYLTHRGMRELFEDSEFFRGCSHLSEMVGDRDITALFAKLYAEEMVSAKRGVSLGKMPENIPDLMLSYANELNQGVREDKFDDRAVHRSAKLIAWECLRKTFRPGAARYEDVVAVLDEENADKELNYLEHRLRLIHAIQPAQDHYHFLLDPMAEYFAAMQLVESNADDENSWRAFLDEADAKEGSPDRIKGFLLAVFDCCRSADDTNIPAFVRDQIAYRVGIEASEQTSRRPHTPTVSTVGDS